MKKNWWIQHKWIPISLCSVIILAFNITSIYYVSNRFHQPVQASSVVSVQLMDLPSSARALPGKIVTNAHLYSGLTHAMSLREKFEDTIFRNPKNMSYHQLVFCVQIFDAIASMLFGQIGNNPTLEFMVYTEPLLPY
jgi:hypothetical protein